MVKIALERIIPSELPQGSPLYLEHIERYLIAVREIENGDVVLDVACGVGYGSAMLAHRAYEVFGLDRDIEAIQYAEQHYQKDNITFIVGDLDSENDCLIKCDVAVCLETLEHLQRPQEFLERLKDKASRAIVLSTPIVPTKEQNEYHLHDWTQQDIERMMEPWVVKHFEQQNQIYGIWTFVPPRQRHFASAVRLGITAEVIHRQPGAIAG